MNTTPNTIRRLLQLLFALLLAAGALTLAQARPDGWGRGGGAEAGPRGGGWHAHPGYRPGHPGYWRGRPSYGYGYPGWRGGYWGPRVGLYWGPGYWSGWPYAAGVGLGLGIGYGAYAWDYPGVGDAYVYSSTPLVVTSTVRQPQTFIQKDAEPQDVEAAPAPSSYWYYCRQPAGYFPYVKDCNQSWLKVVPQTPGESTPPRVAR